MACKERKMTWYVYHKTVGGWVLRLIIIIIIIIIITIIIIIIIIIYIFKEDNAFSTLANLSYGPQVNTDIDYYCTFLLIFGLFHTFIEMWC